MNRGIKSLRGYANGGDPIPGVSRGSPMTGGIGIPMMGRQLMADVAGRQIRERLGWIPGMEKLGELVGSREINELDLSPREMRALQDAVIRGGGGRGGGSVLEYADYATGDNPYSDVGGGGGFLDAVGKIFDPSYSMKTTFGQARVVKGDPARGENPEHYYVDDQYNFNEATQDQRPLFSGEDEEGKAVEGALRTIVDRTKGQGFYGLPRGIGESFGSPEGEGSMARVNIGDLQEALARSRGEERPGLFRRGIEGLRNMFVRGRDEEPAMTEQPPVRIPTPGAFASPDPLRVLGTTQR